MRATPVHAAHKGVATHGVARGSAGPGSRPRIWGPACRRADLGCSHDFRRGSRTPRVAGAGERLSPGATARPACHGRRPGSRAAAPRGGARRLGFGSRCAPRAASRRSRCAPDPVRCGRAPGAPAPTPPSTSSPPQRAHDDPDGFDPSLSSTARGDGAAASRRPFDTHRRRFRCPRRRRLEQKVTGLQAYGAWRAIVTRFGDPAPGPTRARWPSPPTPPAGGASRPGPGIARAWNRRSRGTIVRAAEPRCQDRARRTRGRRRTRARQRAHEPAGVGLWTSASTRSAPSATPMR